MHGEGGVLPVSLDVLGQRYRRYRLADPDAEKAMAGSLRRWGQLAPVVVCMREEKFEVLDGFKRLAAARHLPTWTSLSVRVLAVDEPTAKAAILGLNRGQRATRELEEAWIVQALVREDGLSQVDVAALLNKHKSWVCRRLALLEKLSAAVKAELRLGLLGPALARQLTRLPAGNQEAVLSATRREALTAQEASSVIDLLQSASPEQAAFVLAKPREALGQAGAKEPKSWDPRLSARGNRLSKQLAVLLDRLAEMENFLECHGWTSLQAADHLVLGPIFQRLSRDAQCVADGAADLAMEMQKR